MPGLPDLTPYPGWVQLLVWVLFAAGIAAGGIVGQRGLVKGKKAGKDPNSDVQISMVSLDSTVVREHTAAILGMTAELQKGVGLWRDYVAANDRQQEADEKERIRQEAYQEGLRARRARAAPRRSSKTNPQQG